ncbi:cold-shock protein [Promicromonospora kroppenstedtii]|uniref:cold-shock protein n=1 Tax=Promicromonospora kroppenstedtii TaxID=440482 RepID=UPI000A0047FE|nr:cold shock domain-containing protein [Promicromonospora kroppenstedtii]
MAEGTVTAYDAEAGWGVIVPDDGGPRLRVHQVEILTYGYQVLERGERVAYAVEQDDDGPLATAVTPLGPILTEEELARLGLVPEHEPAGSPSAGDDPALPFLGEPAEPAKFPTPVRAVIALVGLAALPSMVIGMIQVANGHEEWLPLLISGVIMLLVLERIPHERW